MATITSLLAATRGAGNPSRKSYLQELTVDLTAQAISCTGGDIVQCLTVPANTVILWAGVQVIESATMNTGSDATVDFGTSADDDEYVAAYDIDGASDLAYAPAATPAGVIVLSTANTLDLTFAGTGATFTAGKLRVFAMLMDVSEVGDKTAQEVDRDTLA